MKVGDLVKDNHPTGPRWVGIVVGSVPHSTALNKVFKVLWQNGKVGDNIWDYDLKLLSEKKP